MERVTGLKSAVSFVARDFRSGLRRGITRLRLRVSERDRGRGGGRKKEGVREEEREREGDREHNKRLHFPLFPPLTLA